MPKTRILVIDDSQVIRATVKATLSEEGYDVLEAENGEEGLGLVREKSPDLVIIDYNMPKMNGPTFCSEVRKDILISHLPIIMLTGKGELSDKVSGINAGADDYMVKPFEPPELLARIRMILRKTQRDLDANPLTRLPGNVSILNELQTRIDKKALFAIAYVDLDKFKAYNDHYGFRHGDEVIRDTARLLIRAVLGCGNPAGDFIGHIGGDDFVVVTTPEKVDAICENIITEFEKLSPSFYNEEDRKAGYIVARDRKGVEQRFGLLSVSIGVVTNEKRELTHPAQIGEIGAELKEAAKRVERSSYVKDKRGEEKNDP